MVARLYRPTEPMDGVALERALGGAFLIAPERTRTSTVAYLDTFDWRLYNNSRALTLAGKTLTLIVLDGDGESVQVEVDRRPVFAADLPAGRLRTQIQPVLGVRALLVRAEACALTSVFRVLNGDQKTVCRLAVDAVTMQPGNNVTDDLIQLLPVRGYDRELAEIAARLVVNGSVALSPRDMYLAAMQAAGLQPGAYQPKPVVRLDPAMRADKAMKALLRAELEVIQTNEPYISQDIDTEFLHDYRVALRRARSALAEVKGVFSADTTRRLRTDLQVANRFSNELRDLDVYLLSEDRYRAMLPGQLRDGIAPLFDHLRSRRAAALAALSQALVSPQYRLVMDGWASFLNEPIPRRAGSSIGTRPILEIANQRIYRQVRQVLKSGRVIIPESPDEKLHALRIECKKLRYLMELFAGLYEPRAISGLVKHLRILQDNLGDFNDLSVQEAYLMRTASEMAARRIPTPDTLMAIGALVAALDAERAEVRADFAETFAAFAARDNRQRFKQVFGSMSDADLDAVNATDQGS